MRPLRDIAGQATVELAAVLPILAIVAGAAFHVLAAGSASEAAGQSASAGAIALIQGRDPEEAARRALTGWPRSNTRIAVRDGWVTVRVRPRGPLTALSERLARTATADAGLAAGRPRPGASPFTALDRPGAHPGERPSGRPRGRPSTVVGGPGGHPRGRPDGRPRGRPARVPVAPDPATPDRSGRPTPEPDHPLDADRPAPAQNRRGGGRR